MATRQHGLTTVELLTVLVVAAVLVSLAVPSFMSLLARKGVEGVLGEMQNDLQFARTEAVARNLPVRLTFGPGCYVVHTHPPGAGATTCTQSANPTIGAGAVQLKLAQLKAGSTAVFNPNDALTWIEFEPLRGRASWSGTGADASVNVDSGSWQLRATVAAVGRVNTCSPGGSIKGFVAC